VDMILDSALYGLWRFGMYPPDDKRIVETMTAIRTSSPTRPRPEASHGTRTTTLQGRTGHQKDARQSVVMCRCGWHVHRHGQDTHDLRPARDINNWVSRPDTGRPAFRAAGSETGRAALVRR